MARRVPDAAAPLEEWRRYEVMEALHAAQIREWQKSPQGRRSAADRYRRLKYGLEPGQFDAMVLASCGQCALCSRHEDNLAVDHCHAAGVVRGLLCTPCNRVLGFIETFGYGLDWMQAAT